MYAERRDHIVCGFIETSTVGTRVCVTLSNHLEKMGEERGNYGKDRGRDREGGGEGKVGGRGRSERGRDEG